MTGRAGSWFVAGLGGAGVLLLVLAFVAAWTAAESAPGAPALGLVLGTGLLLAAAVAGVAAWTGRLSGLPPSELRDRLGAAGFFLLVAAVGAVLLSFVALMAAPDTFFYSFSETPPSIRVVRGLVITLWGASLLIASAAFLGAWVFGRIALTDGPEGGRLEGPARIRAAIAPFVGALALFLFVLGGPAGFAAAVADGTNLAGGSSASDEGWLYIAVGLGTAALVLGAFFLLVHARPALVRIVFDPLFARLESRHARYFLVAAEVSGALAAVALAVFFSV